MPPFTNVICTLPRTFSTKNKTGTDLFHFKKGTQNAISLYADNILLYFIVLSGYRSIGPNHLLYKSNNLPGDWFTIFSKRYCVYINYEKIFQKLKKDIDGWRTLPASLKSRVSTMKINILPRVNFLSAMIPLPPLSKWWKRPDSLICTFLWNGKQPMLKLAVLQRTKMEGGLSLPNFEL